MCKRTKHKYHSTQAQRSKAHYQTNQGPDKEENKAKTQIKSPYLRRTPPWAKSRSPKELAHQKWSRLGSVEVWSHPNRPLLVPFFVGRFPSTLQWQLRRCPPPPLHLEKEASLSSFEKHTREEEHQSKGKSNTTQWAYALASSRREIGRDVREEFGEEVLGLLVTFPHLYLNKHKLVIPWVFSKCSWFLWFKVFE